MLDARQQRRLRVDKALRKAGLLPPNKGEDEEGHTGIKADVLRVELLDPSFPAHPHDLGRALKNALKRRGYLKPIGRTGPDEGSGFAKRSEADYRQTLETYDCRTIGEFLERCARDARRDGVPFRKRHRFLAWQNENRRRRPSDGDNAPSYEAFKFLSPTHSLIRQECRLLKERSGIAVDDDAWAEIEAAAAGFAPEDRTVKEEREHGRAANPDVHVVMNRLRAVVNGIIEMMGGILPTRCVIEMARSTFSEAQAAAHSRTAHARQELRERIEGEIERILGSKMPVGPALDRLVDRWKAAIRQGWRDYDGNEIRRSLLVDGSEYQLDHVEPAAFGDFREDNIFVSRFNQRKGRRLPWEAFGDDPEFRPALIAFSTFGLRKRIEVTGKKLQALSDRAPRDKRERLERPLERAKRDLDRLSEFDVPRPDVLQALERPPVVSDTDKEEGTGTTRRKRSSPFRPGSQAALFRRIHPDYTPREGGPAARDAGPDR